MDDPKLLKSWYLHQASSLLKSFNPNSPRNFFSHGANQQYIPILNEHLIATNNLFVFSAKQFDSFLKKTDWKSINWSCTDANNSDSSKDLYIQNKITDHDYSLATKLINLSEENQLDHSIICQCRGLHLQPFIFYDKSKSSEIKTKTKVGHNIIYENKRTVEVTQ